MKTVLGVLKSAVDVIELEAFGLTSGMDKDRPVMLFREKNGEAVLPVWLSPLDAGIALTQQNAHTFALSPHDVSLQALRVLGVKPDCVHFTELKGHQQYMEIRFSGSRRLKSLKVRADHAVSFCLQAKAKFFCTRGYLQRCRDLEVEMGQNKTSLNNKSDSPRHRPTYLN